MGLASLEPYLAYGLWPLAIVVAAYVLPRLVVGILALFKVPPENLPDVLKAFAELFTWRK
ncbi:hypothetical protein KZ829_04895 [Actinoplanes hulinensis]|uniref:Uncharacterized protein n=1 Tax=Actinoplanes hulinensis TaxID=1144547 RepID=A0ABS7AWC9_9ACTN|nr:hypothetical protein [Actinoplanes hulinensis]